ncbi:porin [Aquibium sp. ELW1220]|uniref:porin n=1 Tax=Aquibium sp. ELW1220 TaxID=2976766 RepID=UPI0025AF5188|nr:porin [Aquibium sp. ELW1220]MDN2583951.1 porin [Aquibium sp. ELW1220]
MKIKNFLLGTAAALVGSNAAYAADAIVIAEPEPVEYVRVCDMYGAGFFYIPGTETCLQFSGQVFFQVATEGYDDEGDSPDYQTYGNNPGDGGWLPTTRARLQVDARSSTEWGTLRAMMRIQADATANADAGYVMDNAFVQLGGFRVGYTETVWNDSIGAGVASYGSHSWGSLSYGYRKTQQISYSFGSDQGFAATISLENDDLEGDGYVPDVVGAVSYNQGWGAVWAKAGYDESMDGFGATLGLQYNIPSFEGSSFRLIGYYSDSDNVFGVGSPFSAISGVDGNGAAEWSILASYYHQITEKFGASVGFQFYSDLYAAQSSVSTDLDGYTAELNLVYTPVENLEIRSEIYYDKIDTLDGTASGFLRLTRFF